MHIVRTTSILLTLMGAVACASAPHAAPGARLVARFDPAASELPEGFAMDDHAAYVGFAPTSRIVRVDLSTGVATAFGTLPAPVPNQGFMTGLAVSPRGEVFAGLASFTSDVRAGIYRVAAEGGEATLFASHEALSFPNALAFDAAGDLFVTDSGSGSVFRVSGDGSIERWATGALLEGDASGCAGAGPGFAIGANGLLVEEDAVFVVNMDQATLVEIPRVEHDAAGEARIVSGPSCDDLGGADGIARAPNGDFVVALNRQDRIVRIAHGTGAITTIHAGSPLDFPASLAYRRARLYVANFALRNASAGREAAPGIVEITE